MRNRDRFNANIDEFYEKAFSMKITRIRAVIRTLIKELHGTCAIIEPCEYMLSWGSLQRCLLSIESGIHLIAQGYLGSANALLRQMVEFLMWAKLGIVADDGSIVEINRCFYDESFGTSHPVTKFLKHTTILSNDPDLSSTELRRIAKDIYHKYSFCTHATGIAQQNPYRTPEFSSLLDRCLTELCIILDSFLIVFSEYCDKVQKHYYNNEKAMKWDFFDRTKKADIEAGYLFAAAVRSYDVKTKIESHRYELTNIQGNIDSYMQPIFQATWTYEG